MKKKILVYSHFYSPETGAASVRMQSFVSILKEKGNDVKVIAPKPNYPQGKVYTGYEKLFIKDSEKNIVYLPILFAKNKKVITRLLAYLSYFISSLVYTLFNYYKPDVIISSSPPIFTPFSAFIASKLKGTKFILDLRDIWPDIGIQLGILDNRLGIFLLKWIEKILLKNSDAIIVTTNGDKENLISKGVKSEKINIIFNGADVSIFKPADEKQKNKFRGKYRIPLDKKVGTYFGSFNHGMNDIEILGDTLSKLESYKDVFHFVAIGAGNLKETFIDKIKDKISFTNFSSVSTNEVSEIVSACDFSIIPIKKIAINTGGNVPVKCYESLAMGIPFILSVNEGDESSKIFANNNFAKLIPSGDENILKENILPFIESKNLVEIGFKGSQFISENFSRSKQSEKLLDIIESI